jgi:ferredoxin
MSDFHFTVDADACLGGGMCVLAAPHVFAQNEDDGLVVVLDQAPPEQENEGVREAARLCPAMAIAVQE